MEIMPEYGARGQREMEDGHLQQQYLEAILNNANTPIFLKDADYKYIYVNSQFEYLAEVTLEQVQGKDDFEIFEGPVARLFRSQDEAVARCRDLLEFEETISLSDGVHTFITAKFPLFGSQDAVVAIGGTCTDITCRKQAEAELKEAEEKYRGIPDSSSARCSVWMDGVETTLIIVWCKNFNNEHRTFICPLKNKDDTAISTLCFSEWEGLTLFSPSLTGSFHSLQHYGI